MVAFGRSVILYTILAALVLAVFANFVNFLWKDCHCSQVLIRRFVPTPRSYRCLLLSVEKEGVCVRVVLRLISGMSLLSTMRMSGTIA